MKCPVCRFEFEEVGAKKCPNCGTLLTGVAAAANQLSASPTELLQEQVLLLREIRQMLQKSQADSSVKLENYQVLLGDIRDYLHDPLEVKVENINMPFGALVGLIIKWSLASIPAAIILAIIGGLIFLVIATGGFIFR